MIKIQPWLVGPAHKSLTEQVSLSKLSNAKLQLQEIINGLQT